LGQVEWLPRAAEIMRSDPRMEDFTPQRVRADLRAFVHAQGISCIVPRPEDDEYWKGIHPDDPWWYRVLINVPEFQQGLFVKLRLVDPDDDQDPWVSIMGCHPGLQ
jgi:hypothetical protein